MVWFCEAVWAKGEFVAWVVVSSEHCEVVLYYGTVDWTEASSIGDLVVSLGSSLVLWNSVSERKLVWKWLSNETGKWCDTVNRSERKRELMVSGEVLLKVHSVWEFGKWYLRVCYCELSSEYCEVVLCYGTVERKGVSTIGDLVVSLGSGLVLWNSVSEKELVRKWLSSDTGKWCDSVKQCERKGSLWWAFGYYGLIA